MIVIFFQGADMASTARILVAIVQICYEAKNWSALNDQIILLSKRRYVLSPCILVWLCDYCFFESKLSLKRLTLLYSL